METPSSDLDTTELIDSNNEGLSETQKALLDHLKNAGADGIHMTQFFKDCETLGVSVDVFDEMNGKRLFGHRKGNFFVHPDFLKDQK